MNNSEGRNHPPRGGGGGGGDKGPDLPYPHKIDRVRYLSKRSNITAENSKIKMKKRKEKEREREKKEEKKSHGSTFFVLVHLGFIFFHRGGRRGGGRSNTWAYGPSANSEPH